jgi:hypothetical protein
MKEKLVWVSILAVAAFTSLALATTNETESDRAGKGTTFSHRTISKMILII